MNINHLLHTCLFLCFTSFSYCQSISWGNKFDIKKTERVDYIIGHDESGYYASLHRIFTVKLGAVNPYLNKNNISHAILHFDNQLNLTQSVDMALGKGDEKRKLARVVMLEGKLLAFYSFVDMKNQSNTLYAREVDKKTLKYVGKEKEVYKINFPNISKSELTLTWKGSLGMISIGDFNIIPEKDNSRVQVYVSQAINRKKSKKGTSRLPNVKLYVDNQLQVTRHEDEEAEKELVNIESQLEPASDGNAYYLIYDLSNVDQVNEKTKTPTFTYTLFERDLQSDDLPERLIKLETEDRLIYGAKLEMNEKNELICMGFFKRSKWQGTLGGTFLLKIDPKSKKILTETWEDFSMEFLLDGLSEKRKQKVLKRKAKGEHIELQNFTSGQGMKYIIKEDNSGYILIAEQTVFDFRDHPSGFSGVSSMSYDDVTGLVRGLNVTTPTYKTGSIYVFYLNTEGNIEKEHTIYKQQYLAGSNVKYRSYTLLRKEGELKFLFTDSAKNIRLKDNEPEILKLMAMGSILMVSLDEEGNKSREILSSFKKTGVNMRPLSYIETSEHEGVFLGSSHKEEVRLGKIVYK